MNIGWLSPTGIALQTVGLSLLVGGMLALGAFTAPVIFKQFARVDAGEAMSVIFRRYDTVLLAGVAMALVGELIRVVISGGFSFQAMTMLNGFRYGLFAVLTGCILYSTLFVNAEIGRMQKTMAMPNAERIERVDSGAFNKLHNLSERLYKIQLAVALLILIMNPFVFHRSSG